MANTKTPRCSRCTADKVHRQPPADDPGEPVRGAPGVLACALYRCPHNCERFARPHAAQADDARAQRVRVATARRADEDVAARMLRSA